jgi:DNA end-binding protein Ku
MTGPGTARATVIIMNKRGLHARASAKFVETAARFQSEVTVIKDDSRVSGRSIMGLMMLAASPGSSIELTAEGPDAPTPPRSRTIDTEEFVQLAEIDPIFFDKSYYVAPGRASATEKPYALLLQAMRSAGMVAIGRFVLRTRPHLVAIRALENALVLETLFFGDEVRRPEEIVGGAGATSVSERELKMAQQLVRALSTEWVPEKHADVYRSELLELLQRKSPALPAPQQEESAADGSPVDDLMAMLKASVQAAKVRSPGNGYSSVTQRRGKRARGSA